MQMALLFLLASALIFEDQISLPGPCRPSRRLLPVPLSGCPRCPLPRVKDISTNPNEAGQLKIRWRGVVTGLVDTIVHGG